MEILEETTGEGLTDEIALVAPSSLCSWEAGLVCLASSARWLLFPSSPACSPASLGRAILSYCARLDLTLSLLRYAAYQPNNYSTKVVRTKSLEQIILFRAPVLAGNFWGQHFT